MGMRSLEGRFESTILISKDIFWITSLRSVLLPLVTWHISCIYGISGSAVLLLFVEWMDGWVDGRMDLMDIWMAVAI